MERWALSFSSTLRANMRPLVATVSWDATGSELRTSQNKWLIRN